MQSALKTSLFSLTSTTRLHPWQYPHQMYFSEHCGLGLPGAEPLLAGWVRSKWKIKSCRILYLIDASSGQMGVFSLLAGIGTGRRCDSFEAGSIPTGMGWEELTHTWDHIQGTSCPTALVPHRWRSQLQKQEMCLLSTVMLKMDLHVHMRRRGWGRKSTPDIPLKLISRVEGSSWTSF